MHHTTTRTLCAAALLAAALTACSSSSTPKPAPAKSITAKAPAKPAVAGGTLAIGTAQKWTSTVDQKTVTGTATVLAYMQPAAGIDFPTSGLGIKDPVWATVEIRVCNTSGPTISVSQAPWALAFADDTRVQAPIVSGPGLPAKTIAADGAAVQAGNCLRGLVPFPLEKGQHPDRIVYSAQDGAHGQWAIPKG